MEEINLERSELLSLLELKGVEGVIGLEPEQLRLPESFDRPIILDDGRSRLLEQRYLSVAEDHYEIEPELHAMLSVMLDPQAVLRCWRFSPQHDEELWCWYFVSGSNIIQMVTSDLEQFDISRIANFVAVQAQIGELFPLEIMPESMGYRAIADPEDADSFRSLVDDWAEVPALELLTSDGLSPAEAIEFFDDMTEPVWRGRLDFMACIDGQVAQSHRLLLLQGEERSWQAWQEHPDQSELHIGTVTAGAFDDKVVRFWSNVTP